MKKLYIADREAGNIIEEVPNRNEGLARIEEFEKQDREDGIYAEDFYSIIEREV